MTLLNTKSTSLRHFRHTCWAAIVWWHCRTSHGSAHRFFRGT